ncbi:GNAT family N-acetyltransferase [Gordonia hydrophobica]|uniref:GNAT family N-acetyltransferase n=1 Tax=Gordonia hydrophobica TaxID=40516 RepID=A0ABZ2U1Q2_9ACTN|nr:GNAT family N-acetyltransferase [Gordonia hydrophobica]MBM7366606.1 GNAT superfamily N-acetyltransferase [Gordonia hydrophobica]
MTGPTPPTVTVDDRYEFFDDRDRLDYDAIVEFLTHHVYWGTWRSPTDIRAAIAGSWRVVGAVDTTTGELVAFARAISDGVTVAYLADVFVVPSARGHALGKKLVDQMIERGPGAHFRWLLHTADAHGLYKQFGFVEPDETVLERRRIRPIPPRP